MSATPCFVRFLLSLALVGIAASAQERAPKQPKVPAEIAKLLPELPSLVWHASQASARETDRINMLPDLDEFVATYRAKVESVRDDSQNKPSLVSIRLFDPSDEEAHWMFAFRHDGSRWIPESGAIYRGNEKAADLYVRSFASASMRPYMERGLLAFWKGEDFRWLLSRRNEIETGLEEIAATTAHKTARLRLTKDAWLKRKAAIQKPPLPQGKVFTVASPSAVAGAGFVIKIADRHLAVTAAHTHADAPVSFVSLGDNADVPLGSKISEANDVRLLELKGLSPSTFTPMEPAERFLLTDDKLVVVTHAGPVEGTLQRSGEEHIVILPGQPRYGKLTMVVPGKVDFRGNSGAPVLLEETGEVIGILVDSLEWPNRTDAGFELLEFPEPETHLNRDFHLPTKIFSIDVKDPESAKLTKWAATKILPPEFLSYSHGMPLSALRDQRPYFPGKIAMNPFGTDVEEHLDWRLLFRTARFKLEGQAIRAILLESEFDENRAEIFEQLAEWLLAAFGPPQQVFTNPLNPIFGNRAGEKVDPSSRGAVGCVWRSISGSVHLHFICVEKGAPGARLVIAAAGADPREHFTAEDIKWLDGTAEVFRQQVKVWVKDIAKLQ